MPKSVQRIKTIQRNLPRKKPGSNDGLNTKIALAKAWRKVRDRRADTAHKFSHHLAGSFSIMVFEDLNIPPMVKNLNLASAITDASWERLCRSTAYRAKRRGFGVQDLHRIFQKIEECFS